MIVADLIEHLRALPADMPVVVMGDEDGTHWAPPALDHDRMTPTDNGWFIAGDGPKAVPVIRL